VSRSRQLWNSKVKYKFIFTGQRRCCRHRHCSSSLLKIAKYAWRMRWYKACSDWSVGLIYLRETRCSVSWHKLKQKKDFMIRIQTPTCLQAPSSFGWCPKSFPFRCWENKPLAKTRNSKYSLNTDNRPYSYPRYWPGTSLQGRLMWGNIIKKRSVNVICIWKDSPALASVSS